MKKMRFTPIFPAFHAEGITGVEKYGKLVEGYRWQRRQCGNPQGHATRAQVAQMLKNFLEGWTSP